MQNFKETQEIGEAEGGLVQMSGALSCSDKKAVPSCTPSEHRQGAAEPPKAAAKGGEGGERISEERKELRWIDPDEWGRLAWSTLFGAGGTVVTALRLGVWRRLIDTLPKVLPCFSCRNCCGKYLVSYPIGDDVADALPWLGRLRLDVRERNRRDGDVTPAQAFLQDQLRPETIDEARLRFAHRLTFPSLWYADCWLFLGTVFLVADWADPSSRTAIHDFITSLWELTPLPFDWAAPAAPLLNLEQAMGWLLSGKRAQLNRTAWLSILGRIPVRTRIICRKPPTS